MTTASPRMSRYNKETADPESKESGRSGAGSSASLSSTGLSDYTAQRLAELRARRAEREQEYKDLKSSTSSALSAASSTKKESNGTAITTTTASSPTTRPSSTVDSSASFRSARRSAESSAPATPAAAPATNGTAPESKDYSKEYTKDYISKLTAEHRSSGSNLSRNSSRSAADQDDDEVIGFASLPEQVHRKALKRGFDFTLMVVGETGLGKSTLVQSLFLNNELYEERNVPGVQDRIAKTVEIEKKYMEIEERGVKLRLTIVDTPGFNDAVNGQDGWKPVEKYINFQFDQYLNDETSLNRKNIKDNRVHCCLYFVSPFGHGLRQVDINFMKHLHDKVNIVPVIAKADTLTPAEITGLKEKILDEIDQHNIRIYEFPDCDSDEDDEFLQQDRELKAAIPFAVIGSNTIVEMGGKKIRGRQYPWGIVEVDNPEHCDFLKLRQMLISTHMQDLKDVTRDIHYENFRAKHIAEQMTKAAQRERNAMLDGMTYNQYEEINTHRRESKLKRDSSPNFENIMQQDQLLKQKDEEIRKMQEMLMKMQAQLQQTGGSPGQKLNGQLNSGLKKL